MVKLNQNSQTTNNPFQDTDLFTEVIKNDSNIQSQSRKSFQQFITKYYYQPKKLNFMSNILKTISSHSTAFIIGLVIAGSAVGASAAQLTAPEAYKPSTLIQELFKSNKQVDRNPYTALKPDANNDVVKVEACDIALKYPKQLKNNKIDSFEMDGNNYSDPSTKGVFLYTLPNLNLPYEQQVRVNDFSIQCGDTNEILGQEEYFETVNPDEIRKLTGWFITGESKIGSIQTRKIDTNALNFSIRYYFEYNKKFYQISTTTEAILKNGGFEKSYQDELLSSDGIYANQVQIQFNSLVENEANTILKKPVAKPTKNDNRQAINIKLKNETSLKKETNDLVTAEKNGNQAICGLPNAITYRGGKIDEFGNYETEMIIGNKKDYINDKNSLNGYNRVLTYLSNPDDKLTETLSSGFNTSCVGGYISKYGADLSPLKYPGVDQSKVMITLDGQGVLLQPVVRIYAKKGDNIISISKLLSSAVDYTKATNDISAFCPDGELNPKCKMQQADYEAQYEKKQLSPAKIAEAKVEAQKLMDMYTIVN